MSFWTAEEAKDRADAVSVTSVETERSIVEEDIETAVLSGEYSIMEPVLLDENNIYFRSLGYRVYYKDEGVEISWSKPLEIEESESVIQGIV